VASSENGWRDTGGANRGIGKRNSNWTPTREKADIVEAAGVPERVHTDASDFRNIPATPFSGEAWAKAIEAGVQNKIAVAEEEHPTPHAAELERLVGHAAETTQDEISFVSEATTVPESDAHHQSFVSDKVNASESASESSHTKFVTEPESVPVFAVAEISAVPQSETRPEPSASEEPTVVSAAIADAKDTSAAPSWFSTPPNPWDAEAQRANKLASTWDTSISSAMSATNTEDPAATTDPDEIEVVSGATNSSLIPEAIETAREEVSHGAATIDMEDVVARVMARLSPDRLQEVARDLLKPVIENIVREELDKQK
jgi:predicted nucleic acid-binding OB-fold protein